MSIEAIAYLGEIILNALFGIITLILLFIGANAFLEIADVNDRIANGLEQEAAPVVSDNLSK